MSEAFLNELDEMKASNEALRLSDEAAGYGETEDYDFERLLYEQCVEETFKAFVTDGDRDALDRLVRDHRDALDTELVQQYDAMQLARAKLRETGETEAEIEQPDPPHHHM